MTESNLADTRPTKEYLVNGITKDVTIEECIFDLIDNSIDAYPHHTDTLISDYNSYTIDIIIKNNLFSINDGGKGIQRELLKADTLRFGTKTNHHTTSIGYYGIGLNRAIFKLGREINIFTETSTERSVLHLDVLEFLKDNDNWMLPINIESLSKNTGTFIQIKNLNSDVNDCFNNSEWIKDFKTDISLRYSEFINKNLVINFNGEPIVKIDTSIRETSGFNHQNDEFNYGNVKVIIEAGQSSQHFFSYEKSYDRDTNATLKESGWFVYCNDRAVKLFDKTSDTGWDSKPHTQHTGFIGKVFFIGNSGILPWNTSKTDVDLNNEIYKNTLETMRTFFKSWTSHTNKVLKKGHRPITEENPLIDDLFGSNEHDQQQFVQQQHDQQQLDQQQLDQQQLDQQQLDQQQLDQQQHDQQQHDQQQLDQQQHDQQQHDQQQHDQQQHDQESNDQQHDQESNDQVEELPSHEQLLYDIPEHALNQNQLFPNGKHPFNIPETEKKLCSIVNEMSKLRLDPNKGSPYAVLFLIRAFIELSCKYYAVKNQVKFQLTENRSTHPKEKTQKSLAEQVSLCLDHMIANSTFNTSEDSRDIDSIKALCNENPAQKTVRSIQYLQNTLHHPKNIWDKDHINAFWYSILPFLIKCY